MARSDQIQINLEDLKSFREKLTRYDRELESNWRTLQRAYDAMASTWRDVKKEEFDSRVGWTEVQQMKEQYLRTCSEYETFLSRLQGRAEDFLHSR